MWLTGVFGLALGIWGVQAAEEALSPQIVCDEPVYDFGEAPNHRVVEHTFTVRNAGTLALEIRRVRASCGCTAVRSSQEVIPPGQSGAIEVRFDLRGRRGQQYKSVFVESNDPQTPTLNLQVRGTALQPLRVEPATLFYGRVEVGSVPPRVLTIIADKGPMQLTSLRSDNPGILLRELPREEGADASEQQVEVTISPDQPAGQLRGTIAIQTDRKDAPELTVAVAAFLVATPTDAQ